MKKWGMHADEPGVDNERIPWWGCPLHCLGCLAELALMGCLIPGILAVVLLLVPLVVAASH
jgi:hypothetical protein